MMNLVIAPITQPTASPQPQMKRTHAALVMRLKKKS